jgi:hypothetical protein
MIISLGCGERQKSRQAQENGSGEESFMYSMFKFLHHCISLLHT